jgi:hypothetical protein
MRIILVGQTIYRILWQHTAPPSTGYSPNFLMFGRELYTPLDVIIKTPLDTQISSDEYVDRHQNILHNAYWTVRDHLNAAMQTNKRYYDESVHKHYTPLASGCGIISPDFTVGNLPNGLVFTRVRSGSCNALVILPTSYNNDRSHNLWLHI